MEIGVELKKGEKVIVKCQKCDGSGEIVYDNNYKKCSRCDGTGKIEQELAEAMVVYKEIDEGEIVNNMEPRYSMRSG